MKKFSFHYGRGQKEFSLDESRIIDVVNMPVIEPMADVKQGVLDAIYNPIGCEPIDKFIKPGDTVAFICNDPTRVANSFDFMPVMVNELNKLGVKDEDMHIVFALGTHREMTQEEMVEAVGEDVASRLKMYNSICKKDEDFEYFGTTSRGTKVNINKLINHVDHVFLTGTIVYHFFSGYGGGRKAVLPGCAHFETVRHNHSFMLDPNAQLGATVGNPVYEDQMEGVALWAKNRSVFLFNGILNEKHEFLKMFAGNYVDAHKEACKFVDVAYGVPIKEKADIVIVSCGGYPKDINVYQMQKTMDNAVCACKQDGVVVLLAECVEGSGSAVLEESIKRLGTPDAIEEELRQNFQIGAHKAFAITRNMKKAKFILVSAIDRELAKDLLFTAAVDEVDEAIAMAEEIVGKDAKIILMPAGSLTLPRPQ